MSKLKLVFSTFLLLSVSFLTVGQSGDSTSLIKETPIMLPVVNAEKSTEFSPTISADGKTLIFESDRVDDKWMLFQSQMNEGGVWSDPAPIDSINNACDFIGGPNLSFDGNTLYYTAFIEGETQTEDIYFSSLVAGGWSAPKRFMGTVNTDDGYEGFSSIASDERSIYFITVNEDYPYDKKNKENCFKILVSAKSIQGEWSVPEPLPEQINSGCVRDPKIMADNRTLLFSALTAGEKGKFNMYQSQIQIDGSWGTPIALDYVNTELNNLAPAIPASGDIMYFNSEGNIYTIGIAPEYRQFFNASIVGHVRDFKTGEGMAAKIIIKDANNLEVISVLHANERGRFNIVLNGGRNYKVEFEMDDYLSQSFDYPLYYASEYVEEVKTVKLRSDADLGLIVFDKGLNTPMPATISILEGDSLISAIELIDYESSDNNLQLDVNKQYSIVASAKLFNTDSIAVNTAQNTSLNLKFYLAPKTVAYDFNVKDVTSKRRLKSKLTLKNKNKDEIIDGYADETFHLRQGDQYEVLTSGDRGYLLSSMTIDVPILEEDVEGVYSPAMRMDMDVTPLAVGVSLVLNSISFETNSSNLSAESLLELDRVYDFMSLNENISIEISAHSDDVGGDGFNLDLSKRRAASVEDYLVQKSIAVSRMQSVGYGEQKPLVPNDSDENRAKNRRVELQVIKVD